MAADPTVNDGATFEEIDIDRLRSVPSCDSMHHRLLNEIEVDRALIEAKDAEIEELNRVCAAAIAYRNAVVGGQTDRILITTQRELDASVRALSEPAVEASPESVTTKHMSHWQSGCNCLGDSAICCVESCECYVVPDSLAEPAVAEES